MKAIKIPLKVFLLTLSVTILMLGIAVGLLVWKDYQSAEFNFRKESGRIHETLSRNIINIDSVLSGFAALHNAIELVDADQFSQYARHILKHYPLIYSIKLLGKVEKNFREQFTEKIREEGFPAFEIKEGKRSDPSGWKLATSRPVYFPITAIEPMLPSRIAEIGFDLNSDVKYRDVIRSAIESGNASSVSTYLPGRGDGYMVFMPIYAGRIPPENTYDRKSQILYLISVEILARDLLAGVKITPGFNVVIYKKNEKLRGLNRIIHLFHNKNIKEGKPEKDEFRYDKVVNINGQSILLSISYPVSYEIFGSKKIVTTFLIWGAFVILILYIFNTHYARLAEREESLYAWQREKERADVTLHSLADAVITTNLNGVVEYMNPVAERLTGWKAADAKGHGIEDVFVLVDEASEKKITSPAIECIQRGVMKKSDADISLVQKDGEYCSVDYSIAPMYGNQNMVLGAVLIFQDVGASRMMSKLLEYQATHDDLTGLYNRREFEKRMSRAMERAFKHNDHYILMYMDLDQFKVINDTCGHVAGDVVLRQITELTKPHLMSREIMARLGGDEFGLLLEGYSLKEANKLANKLLKTIRKYRFQWTDKIFEIGVSIGIVDIDSDMQSISNVMSYADAACYMAKEMGGNHIQVYQMDDDDYKHRKDQMNWVQRITQAFTDNRFILYAQKIVPLQVASDEEHYEILMRMIDDNGDIIVPQDYIIAAERYRTMKDIDRWVIRNSFIKINKYLGLMSGDPSLPVKMFSINISGQTLSSQKELEYVREQLLEYTGISQYIIFEITETAAISNLVSAQKFIDEFRGMGVRFSLDDFGTGVSSFNYLKNLKVDYLKIDGGFVREMMEDTVDYAMVKSIAHIGSVMGIKTIAEHAEKEIICDNLREMGVDYAQGFYLHEPEDLKNIISS